VVDENIDAKTSTLRHHQEKSSKTASSFQPSRFNPHPLLRNRHLQTISGVFLRDDPNCAYVTDESNLPASLAQTLAKIALDDRTKSKEHDDVDDDDDSCDFWDVRRRIRTPDGDFFHVDIKYHSSERVERLREGTAASLDGDDEDGVRWWRSRGSKGTVLVLHGLESNSNSTLSTDMSNAYHRAGFDVLFLNFRGCSGEPNDTIGAYHVGFTDDLMQVLNIIADHETTTDTDIHNIQDTTNANDYHKLPIFLSGFSLGANVVLKALGEMAETAIDTYNIHAAAVTGAPFDQELNIKCVDAPGFNRNVYSANLIRTIKQRAQYQLDRFCDGDTTTTLFDYQGVMKATTIAMIDDTYIAPIYGFQNNVDYWRRNSCIHFLDTIAVPTIIVNAADDPFFDSDFFPWDKGCDYEGGVDHRRLPIKLVRTEHGGHLGYMFHDAGGDDDSIETGSSWMPAELARFLVHVQTLEDV